MAQSTTQQREEDRQEQLPVEQREELYLAPSMGLEAFRKQMDDLKHFIEDNLKEGPDYGRIPGTPKPTLLKSGAEKLLRWHGLVVDNVILPSSRLDITGGVIDVDIEGTVRSVKTGQTLGTVHSNCNSEEYRYYNARNPEDRNRRPQRLGDQKNTIIKMADKRTWVAAALLYTMASEIFTQDIEDVDLLPHAGGQGQARPEAGARPAAPGRPGQASELRVSFPYRGSEEIRATLKANGWRFDKDTKEWYWRGTPEEEPHQREVLRDLKLIQGDADQNLEYAEGTKSELWDAIRVLGFERGMSEGEALEDMSTMLGRPVRSLNDVGERDLRSYLEMLEEGSDS